MSSKNKIFFDGVYRIDISILCRKLLIRKMKNPKCPVLFEGSGQISEVF